MKPFVRIDLIARPACLRSNPLATGHGHGGREGDVRVGHVHARERSTARRECPLP